jgi:subtilisin family serine protease
MNARWCKTIGIVSCLAACAGSASAQSATAARINGNLRSGTVPDLKFKVHEAEQPQQFWIVKSKSACRSVVQAAGGTWRSRQLRVVPRPAANANVTKLEHVCSYVWTGAGTPDLKPIQAFADVMELDPPVVSSHADPERDEKWFKPLYELTRARLSVPRARDPHPSPRAVRVAVLDTASDTAGGYDDKVGHGRAVRRLIEEVACGELQECAVEVFNIGALPYGSTSTDISVQPNNAGGFGTKSMLADAIEQVSSAWAQESPRTRPANLVINLSLGWSSCYENDALGWFDSRSVGSQAVLESIGRAACRGASVIAASGNTGTSSDCPAGAPGKPGRMYPGSWGGQGIDPEVCTALGISAVLPDKQPALLSVGGVNAVDGILGNVNNWSNIVAQSQAVTVPDPTQSTGWTRVLSGTSMGAAAASGIAAALLSYDPSLTPAAVADLIASAAVPLLDRPNPGDPMGQDFICNDRWRGADCKEVRRLSVCDALASVTPMPDCETPKAFEESTITIGTLGKVAIGGVAVDCDDCGGACPAECSLATAPDARDEPWVVPQPLPQGCGTCVKVFLLPIFQAEFEYAVNSAVLTVNRPFMSPIVVSLSGGLGIPGLLPKTWLLPLSTTGGTSARLSYRVSSTFAVESGDVLMSLIAPFEIPQDIKDILGL